MRKLTLLVLEVFCISSKTPSRKTSKHGACDPGNFFSTSALLKKIKSDITGKRGGNNFRCYPAALAIRVKAALRTEPVTDQRGRCLAHLLSNPLK